MSLLVTNAHVVDVRGGNVDEGDVCCGEGRIRQLGADVRPDRPVETHGGFVVPGLIDAHAHLTAVDVGLGVAASRPYGTWARRTSAWSRRSGAACCPARGSSTPAGGGAAACAAEDSISS